MNNAVITSTRKHTFNTIQQFQNLNIDNTAKCTNHFITHNKPHMGTHEHLTTHLPTCDNHVASALLDQTYSSLVITTLGIIRIEASNTAVTSIYFQDERNDLNHEENNITRLCSHQLQEYFSGQRRSFNIPIAVRATPFQHAVWLALLSIPMGNTVSYKDLATKIGNPLASRAVGKACHSNPIAIIIPCHRVLGKSGNLFGYAWGTGRKKWLLEHELIMRTNCD